MNRSYSVTENYHKAKEEYLNTTKGLAYVCEKWHISPEGFADWLHKDGISTKTKLNKSKTQFDIIDTEEKAYWLGFLYADGCVRYNSEKHGSVDLCLAEIDKYHVERFKIFMGAEKELKYRASVKAWRYIVSSKYLVESLIKLGCVPNKSLILTFPTEDQVPLELQRHFIRGYFDGDGCISIAKTGSFNISFLGTYEFLEKILQLYEIKTDIIKKDVRRINSNNFYVNFKHAESYKFLTDLYENSNLSLDRKYEKYLKFKFHYENHSTANPNNKTIKQIPAHKVLCVSTGRTYRSIRQASELTNISYGILWRSLKENKEVNNLKFIEINKTND